MNNTQKQSSDDKSTRIAILRRMLKEKKYYISLQIMIPVIFSGLTLLSIILASRLTIYCLNSKSNLMFTLFALGFSVLTFLCGVFIVFIILRPLKIFVSQAEQIPVIQAQIQDEATVDPRDELKRFSSMYTQITEALSKVKAKEMFPEIVGQSRIMRGIFSQILKVAPTDATVLITGESGTGKELVAKTIHRHSSRKDSPFVAINCAAIPETLLESELFGHEKGAFTGAVARKPGRFELAHTGTVFLDEIGDMPLALQAKILRVLQEKEIEPVGGTRTVKIDVRFIAATNKNLRSMVDQGLFREDLFYRLNVVAIHLPPLRERKIDIPLLVEEFLAKSGRTIPITPETLEQLTAYHWPGNIRELESTVESAAVSAQNRPIDPAHLPTHLAQSPPPPESKSPDRFPLEPELDKYLEILEKNIILQALQKADGVQVAAAELLGIKERSLWHRIKKFGLDVNRIKPSKN